MGVACSRGCFCCNNAGDGPATGRNTHSTACCGSTLCDSTLWKKQVKEWLTLEDQYKNKKAVTEWLLAEAVFVATPTTVMGLAVPPPSEVDALRERLTKKAPTVVRQERQRNSPQLAKERVAQHAR